MEGYRLVYWPGLPGRGEYVRLVLEEAGASYVDTAILPEEEGGGVPAVLEALRGGLGGVRPFAPPILQHGDLAISQTVNVCRYLGLRHGLWPADPALDAVALEIALTVADLVEEVHRTHHPVAVELYYEDQHDAALAAARSFRSSRLPKHLQWLEVVLADAGGTWMVGGSLTAVDLAVFHTMRGLAHAFPRATEALAPSVPLLRALVGRVAARPRIAAWLASDRRQPFSPAGLFRHYPELDAPVA